MIPSPRRADRRRQFVTAVLVHPFESTFGLVLVLLALQEFGVGLGQTRVDTAVGPLVGHLWAVGNMLGGLALLAGTLRSDLAICRGIERAGLCLVASTTAVYAVAVYAVIGRPASYTAVIFLAFSAACILRVVAIGKAERAVLAALRVVATGEGPLHPVELAAPARRATDRRHRR